MAQETTFAELESAIAEGRPLGPEGSDTDKPEIDGSALRNLIRSRPSDEEGRNVLWIRRHRISGSVDMESQVIGLRLIFEDCEFVDSVNLQQARAANIDFLSCVFQKRLLCQQLDMRWDLNMHAITAEEGVELQAARIGGQLSLWGSTLNSPEDNSILALAAYQLNVGRDMSCRGLIVNGGISLFGAKIGGQLSLREAQLNNESAEPGRSAALSADGIEVAQGLFLRPDFKANGGVIIVGSTIGGEISADGAEIKAGSNNAAIAADRARIGGSIFLRNAEVSGEMRLHNAKIEGSLSMDGARLKTQDREDQVFRPAFSGDGVNITGDIFCREEFEAEGEVRLPGANIVGSVSFAKASLTSSENGSYPYALSLDRIRIGEHLNLVELTAHGRVRLPGAEIGGQLALVDANLKGESADNSGMSLDASRTHIAKSMLCYRMAASERVDLKGIDVAGQLSFDGACITGENGPASLALIAARADELVLSLREANGILDLRGASVRSLWDAEGGNISGTLPPVVRLEGFAYQSLKEPLNAKQRLAWIEPSQRECHYPGVYGELAAAFRRAGHLSDARKVAIASERRARNDTEKWSFRRLWHDLLWITVGYGYRNWLAGIWLLALIAAGTVLFALNEGAFARASAHPPPFNPFFYAVDVTIPVLDLGQTQGRVPTGCMAWVGLTLAVSGYALVAAVLAAATGLLNREQS